MFNFMKKAAEKDDKEKRKREKKERKDVKKRDRSSMSAEELLRLDEVRRSLKIPGRRKEKEKLPSGITADYSASFFAHLDRDLLDASQNASGPGSGTIGAGTSWSNRTPDGLTQSDSSEASLTSLTTTTTTSSTTTTHVGGGGQAGKNLPPLPPKPPKRGILKGPRLTVNNAIPDVLSEENALPNGNESSYQEASNLLVRNTLQNEVIAYQNVPAHLNSVLNKDEALFSEEETVCQMTWRVIAQQQPAHQQHQHYQQSQQQQQHHHHQSDSKLLQVVTSASPSADSLTDTTNSSFATPPFSLSPVGESQGFSRWRSSVSFEEQGIELQLPELVPLELPEPRELTIQRQPPPRSDFGFSLRRAVIVERTANGVTQMRPVIFAEPGVLVQHNNDTGLLPGDRLIEVNGINVDDKSREEIIDLIKSSASSVVVKVQPVAELSELSRRGGCDGRQVELAPANIRGGTLRRSGSLRFHQNTARSEEHLAQEQAWLSSEKVWLLHRGGFTLATKCGAADPDTGKLRIRLATSGEELLVDEEDVEKANPPQFDKAEELSQLRFLNESSVLHTLRQRYASNLIHTYAGDSMIVINPIAPLAIYSEKVAHMFRGCKTEDMPPHIYAIAQSAYRGMLATRKDHSLVFLGRSGAGKTTNFKHALHYLVLAAGTVNKILTIEKLNALFTVLEAFGNSRTHMNSNATRFTQLFSLDFDQSGQIASASLQVLLLEKSRIGRRANADPTFHAVYRLLAGAEGALRKELHLTNLVAENNPFVTPLQKHEDKQRAMVEFNRIVAAFRILGISEADEKVIWLVLSGIYHLSCAGAVKAGTSSQSRWQFARVECAEKAANLLGTTVEELSRILFASNGGGAGTPSTPRPALRTPSPTEQGKDLTGLDALEGLLVGLYSEIFHCVAALINRSISSAVYTVSSLLLCDSPGFQNPASCGRQTGATFEDLCHNYLQERLQLLFHHTTLVAPKDRYIQEGIDVDYEDDYDEDGIGSPQSLVSLLDRGSSQSATMLRTSQNDLSGSRQMERKGLLWLLDEETVCPGGSDETFLDRLFSYYGDRDHQMLLRKAPGNNQFVLQHLLGTNPVLYTATGWLKATRENPVAKSAITLLQESTREHVSMLFVSARGAGVSGALCGSMPGLEGSQSLRRASSIRRTFTAVKRKNVCLQVKFTVDGLVETLRRTRVKFVHCLLPQHNAGCTDNKSLLSVKSNQSEDSVINVPLLRSQIRGSQIIDVVRLHKVGFPKHMALGEFRRRFGLLSSDVNARPGSPVTDERRAVEDMLLTVDVDPASYRVGQSQIDVGLSVDMSEIASKCATGGGGGDSRLVKARSSPNVSKAPPLPAARKQSLSSQTTTLTCPSKSSRSVKTTTTTTAAKVSSRMSSNDAVGSARRRSVSADSSKFLLSSPSKPRRPPSEVRPDATRTVLPNAQRNNDKRKICKSNGSSPSCTILEDRALLKKGLAYAPDKIPTKPETLRGKAVLDRSVSLGCVSSDNNQAGPASVLPRGRDSAIAEKRSPCNEKTAARRAELSRRKSTPMNRSVSLWSVQTSSKADHNNQCRKSSGVSTARLGGSVSRPSKIPLPAVRYTGLGRSLADLSQVDRVAESAGQVVSFQLDLDATSAERIYENCRGGDSGRAPKLGTPSISVSTSNLEERAAQLMAQLEEDDGPREETVASVDVTDVAPPHRTNVVYEERGSNDGSDALTEKPGCEGDKSDARSRLDRETKRRGTVATVFGGDTEPEGDPKKKEFRAKENELNRSYEKPEEVVQEPRRNKESLNIQELRRNWEKHSRGAVNQDNDAQLICTANIRKTTVNLSRSTRSENDVVDGVQDTTQRRQQCVGKRAKDVEHLVNFFNCKNAGSNSKETAREAWIKPRTADVQAAVVETPVSKKSDAKGANEYSGYASDGNCSEDSGHMSNENEVEWKEAADNRSQGKDYKGRQYYGRIDRSEDGAKMVFGPTLVGELAGLEEKKTIVNRESSSMSSGASSIDSCRDDRQCVENGRQIFFRSGTLERLEAQRDEKLTGHIILLQARCRGYLARRKLNTLKLQDLAVRCIQRNVRKLMSVREWPWWRLYVKVAPLLNVHRTEDQLKARTEELELLRAKVERLEQERNHLKHDNDKLEAKLSEMTADFAEEHSTSTLAAERIDAETSERLRLERELQDVTEANKNLQQTTERLEMELLYARAADLNGVASDGEEGEDGGVYRQRYEHAVRELEFTKRKMAQQHEDDLEQLVGLKKQLEKKLADAYEEVEEQRQVVGQWKRRVQKLNGEMHDLRLLLEEQTARNNLLEKKQRKFDSETQNLMNDLRQEKAQRERLAREKEIAIAEKFTVEQNLSDARLEIELKEERLRTLTQELEELTFGGKTEEEVAQLKKAKHELEKRAKDQEEELDDLAGQVQLLEQAKLRLEMSIEQQRKEMRKEMQQRDEELEDVRGNAHKKVKALESQLENEHEERTILLREKHELERRLVAIEEQDRADRAAEAETMQRLKRDLKRTRALLRDAQTMLERSKGDSTGKVALRQLKNQLEDAECARAVAIKAKQALEQELNETQATLEEAMRHRSEAEERANAANRERTELLSQLEENEEELAEVLKKYRAAVQQVSAEQGQLQEAQVQIAALEAEKSSLKDHLAELTQRLESVEQLGDPTANSLATRRLEFRAKELESKLELEQTTRARLETQIARLKESVEKLQTESALLRTKEQTAQDAARRLQRSLRDARDEASAAISREQEAMRARRDIEKSLEAAEAETKVARDDLRLALQRIDDLQSAIQGELDLDCSEEATSENSDSD